MDVNGVRPNGIGLVVPHLHRDALAGQNVGLLRRSSSTSADSMAVRASGSPASIASRVAGSKLRVPHASTGPTASGGRRCNACTASNELGEVKWLDEIIVRALVEAGNPIGRGVAGGEHENGRSIPARPRFRHDFDPRTFGHAPIEHGHVVLIGAQVAQRRCSVRHRVDDISVLTQPTFEDRPQCGIVLCHQNPHRSGELTCDMGLQARAMTTQLAMRRLSWFLQVRSVPCLVRWTEWREARHSSGHLRAAASRRARRRSRHCFRGQMTADPEPKMLHSSSTAGRKAGRIRGCLHLSKPTQGNAR